jgi:hypothetical protein
MAFVKTFFVFHTMKSSQYQDRETIEAVIRSARHDRDVAIGRALSDFSLAVSRAIAAMKRAFQTREERAS